jgi:hypothetical protein
MCPTTGGGEAWPTEGGRTMARWCKDGAAVAILSVGADTRRR